jgi:hypothetical protein
MELAIPVVIIFTFFIGSFVMISLHLGQMSARRALPSRDAYLQQSASLACSKCGSSEQREFGLDDQHDQKRIVACAACNKELFQFRREDGTA